MLHIYGVSLYGLTSYYSTPQKAVSQLNAVIEENPDLVLRSQHSNTKGKEDIIKQLVEKSVGILIFNSADAKVGEVFCSKVL